jgi:tetratricopeptide (TPR) repeat protein
MAKFTPADVSLVAERLKRARDRSHPAHFLIGAGCSISAGIPSAKELISRIHEDYPTQCAALSDDKRYVYGKCMALLSINERRDLIRPYLRDAKINWGTVALAQLIAEGFVDRVLTVNFDLVLENACGLLGLQPAVYDFGVAPASDFRMIVSPAIVHLHGQSYGLVLLNTEEETQKHRKKLQPILVNTLHNAPLVVIGYSGSADGISQNLVDEYEGLEPLYWVGYEDELASHLRGFLKKSYFHHMGGADFDRFMIELAQSLECWPPRLFKDPLGHLLEAISQVVAYPGGTSASSIDLLADLRSKLRSWQPQLKKEAGKMGSLRELYMKGDYEGAAKLFSSFGSASLSDADRDIGYWSFVGLGNKLAELAKSAGDEEASQFSVLAGEKYNEAFKIRSDKHEALYNWGNLLSTLAESASNEEALRLRERARDKYAAALLINPDDFLTLEDFGILLMDQADHASGDEKVRLLAEAAERLGAAAKKDPGRTFNLACLAGLRGDEEQCRCALENAEKHGKLPSVEHLSSDGDLTSMRDKPWFQEIIDRLEEARR